MPSLWSVQQLNPFNVCPAPAGPKQCSRTNLLWVTHWKIVIVLISTTKIKYFIWICIKSPEHICPGLKCHIFPENYIFALWCLTHLLKKWHICQGQKGNICWEDKKNIWAKIIFFDIFQNPSILHKHMFFLDLRRI